MNNKRKAPQPSGRDAKVLGEDVRSTIKQLLGEVHSEITEKTNTGRERKEE